ncbi:MAG TPA: hypothetical protein DHW63_03035 [Hyphomonadaceae bacterium]|nr:hypothetical protein [Hyphomonadaceae bacterium]
MYKPTLIVLAKAPRIGVGKTRLAAELGRSEAWRINRALQAHTMRVARDYRWRTLLCVTPDSAVRERFDVWPSGLPRMRQGAGDLGVRLARALAGKRRVAIIGTDCPSLTPAHLVQAFTALKRKPFVLGPTHDGGFWLLAARSGRAAARAMDGVRWSSAHAAADVLRNLGAANVALLPMLRDIDVAADWAAYRSAKRESSGV